MSDFHTIFCIPDIQMLELHLARVRILGNHHCGNTCHYTFNPCGSFQDVLCHCDSAERVVSSCTHQIKYEYYGFNRYVLLKELYWINLVIQHIYYHCPYHNHKHAMMCFANFFLITSNRILLPQLHTTN